MYKCIYIKGELGHRSRHIWRKAMWRHREMASAGQGERPGKGPAPVALGRSTHIRHLISDLQAPGPDAYFPLPLAHGC